jgi:hypothetical protein
VLNVKTELGAVGDGVADDTEALQQAIELCYAPGQPHSRFIYLPEGTYRITRQLIFRPQGSDGKEGSMVGPWLFGESREGTVIRLEDGAAGFGDAENPRAMIRGVSRPDGSRMNADFFDRMLVNLTLDTGDNPGAVGIKFYSNNTGEMRRVTIRGNGAVGLDLGFNDQNGPLLIDDVRIEGFRLGVNLDYGINSQTLSRVTVTGAEVGLRHRRQIVTVEDLVVEGAKVPVECLHGGTLVLLNPRFTRGPGDGAAVKIAGEKIPNLYIRNLEAEGYGQGIDGGAAPGGSVAELEVREYSSKGVVTPGGGAEAGLFLAAPRAPEVPWENDPEKWVCANDFGMTQGAKGEIEEDDDGAALQRVIDAAAAKGATTVYIIGGPRANLNWFHIRSDVRVHGSVNRIIGMGFVRLLNGHEKLDGKPGFPEMMPKIYIEDEAGTPPAVVFEHLNVFAPRTGFVLENRARSRTLVVRASTPAIVAREGTTVFAENTVSRIFLEPESRLYARHLNTEGDGIQIHNENGKLVIIGFKTERSGTKLLTTHGGVSEVFGSLIYNNTGDREGIPCFEVRDAWLFSGGFQEVHFGGNWYNIPVRETVDGQSAQLEKRAWMGWAAMRAGNTGAPRGL